MSRHEKQERIREAAVEYLKGKLDMPYIWGGQNPQVGFDCSGLAVDALWSHGVIPRGRDYSAEGLRQIFQEFKLTSERPHAGCLVFFINRSGKAYHVAMMVDDFFIIHAAGGSSTTTTPGEAMAADAYVKKDLLINEISRRDHPGHAVEYSDPFRSMQ